jgi:hypothetical protein
MGVILGVIKKKIYKPFLDVGPKKISMVVELKIWMGNN